MIQEEVSGEIIDAGMDVALSCRAGNVSIQLLRRSRHSASLP